MPNRPTRIEFRAAVAEFERFNRPTHVSFVQKRRAKRPKPARLIAYDFETTRIDVGTPRPLYLTAYGEGREAFNFSAAIRDMAHLRMILLNYFLIEEFEGVKFVAWNGNNFDAYFVAAALLGQSQFILRPYMTKSKAVRGLRVSLAEDGDSRTGRTWEFVDGIAMTGLIGTKLEKFLETFAPDYPKHSNVIDFEGGEEFDHRNPAHREYAMRDSVGLYHGITRAQSIMLDHFDEPLAVTMGGVCIKIFAAHIPRDTVIRPLDPTTEGLVRDYVARGGFCALSRRYTGPVWKYDINQAYAASMREALLPAGELLYSKGLHRTAKVYMARLTGENADNKIPFYYRTKINGRITSQFSLSRIEETWLTSIEVDQLRAEGWKLSIAESHQWSESFSMIEFVDKLERLRQTCDGGPKGAIGIMVKATGNHSFGKTLERDANLEFVIAGECPDSYVPYYGDDSEPLDHVFFRFAENERAKAHHQPQLGAFITAHCRMVLRRIALQASDAWLYADTDCLVFTRDVSDLLDIDESRYGAWKIEESGTPFRFIAKKVYAEVGFDTYPKQSKAKGMRVRKLTNADFEAWERGMPPIQDQIQKQNFLSVMRGADMFRLQQRSGTRIA